MVTRESVRPTEQFLSRQFNHLGILGAKLRDLSGFATLAYELIQNAEDARAGVVTFRISTSGLTIDNDAEFSSCGAVESDECEWKSDGRSHMCDFHRFRQIAAADKRTQEKTIGAFGIGFIAVYQVTDTPHLLSAGRHWIIDEAADADHRIRQCAGCASCDVGALPGTRVFLPWARDPESPIRKALLAEPIDDLRIASLKSELVQISSNAILFLQNIRRLEVFAEDALVSFVEVIREGGQLLVDDKSGTRVWHLLEGGFDAEASKLRAKYRDNIEAKRSAQVKVAVPVQGEIEGRFFAYLPTADLTQIPLHIHADFFPSSDRKRIILDAGYQAEWNGAAILASAELIARNIQQLSAVLSPESLWGLFEASHTAQQDAEKGRSRKIFGSYWAVMLPQLRRLPVFLDEAHVWRVANEVVLLETKEEDECIPFLQSLDLHVVHPILRPFFPLLRTSGVRLLELQDLATAIAAGGTAIPAYGPSSVGGNSLEIIWREIRLLASRARGANQEHVRQLCREIGLVPCTDGKLRAGLDVLVCDPEVEALLQQLGSGTAVALRSSPAFPRFEEFCRTEVVEALISAIESSQQIAQDLALRILTWFDGHKHTLLHDKKGVSRLAQQQIFPTHRGLRSLSDVSLPGDFRDVLGLAEIVDVDALKGRLQLLKDLGARELSIAEYAVKHVPRAFRKREITPEKKREVAATLAANLGKLLDEEGVRVALQDCELVECTDGRFRRPADVYENTPIIQIVLGRNAPIAQHAKATSSEAYGSFLKWLGVAAVPRIHNVVDRITDLASRVPTDDAVSRVQACFSYLGECYAGATFLENTIETLRDTAWLPAESDRQSWHRPRDLTAVFQRHLFESQATFLDVPLKAQQSNNEFLKALGVSLAPTVAQVVAHLRESIRLGQAFNKDVYTFLNVAVGNAENDLIIRRLQDFPCIALGDGRHVSPSKTFWSDHPFGKFRFRLSGDFRRYSDLFNLIGVKEAPTERDAIEVLMEISEKNGSLNATLDDEAIAVVLHCWKMLSSSLPEHAELIDEVSGWNDRKLVPDPQGTLAPPSWLFFDDAPGLATKFPILRNNIIPKTEGAWPAMRAAGVRSLFHDVKREVLEAADPAPHTELSLRLQERAESLVRVAQSAGEDAGVHLEQLVASLEVSSVETLIVRFFVPDWFGKDLHSPPETIAACLDPERSRLFIARNEVQSLWSGVARELAKSIHLDLAQWSSIASGLHSVLSAESTAAAASLLDDLGYERPLVEAPSVPISNEMSLPDDNPHPSASGEVGGEVVPPTDGLGDSGLHRAIPNANELSPNLNPQLAQEKLRSYVIGERSGRNALSADLSGEAHRVALDRAGIAAVLSYERLAGRLPTEMSHTHPGYDIESRDASGEIVRYIEVKSSTSAWGEQGVALSSVQFERATALRDKFWLYVVSEALAGSPKMFRIQDPANRVTQFFYDNGWADVAESDEPDGETIP